MKKLIITSFILLILASCSNPAPSTPMPVPTVEALPSVIPTETLPALSPLPSVSPTVETLATAMPDSGDLMDPRGAPAQEWRGIPIMPGAIAGQDFGDSNAYSFRANVAAMEVQDFYAEALAGLGWSQPFDNPFGENGGMLTFRKEGGSLTITVIPSEESVLVLLVMALA